MIERLASRGAFAREGTPFPNELEADIDLLESLLPRTDPDDAGRLTLAGLLFALYRSETEAEGATPEYDGRGELYSWELDAAVGHVVRYRRLLVWPGDGSCQFAVLQRVPRPSLLGNPYIETGLTVRFPV